MKKLFWTCIIGAILVQTLRAGEPAQPVAALADEKEQKQKIKIVVVDKKEQPGGNQSQKPRTQDRNRKP